MWEALRKNLRDYFVFFVCQIHSEVLKHVLQRGVVISDQFYHLKIISFVLSAIHSGKKTIWKWLKLLTLLVSVALTVNRRG